MTAIERALLKEQKAQIKARRKYARDLKEAQRAFLAAAIRQGLHMDDDPDVRETYTNFVRLLNVIPKFKPGTECVNDLTSFSELGQGPLAERK